MATWFSVFACKTKFDFADWLGLIHADSLCHSVHHKSHMVWPGIKPDPPRCQTGDQPPESWHSHGFYFEEGQMKFGEERTF